MINDVRKSFKEMGQLERFKQIMSEINDEVDNALSNLESILISEISGMFGAFSPLVRASLKDLFKNVDLSGIGSALGKAFSGAGSQLGKIFKPIKGAFDLIPLSNDISNILGAFASGLSQYAGPIIGIISSALKTTKQYERMQKILTNLLEALGKALEPILQVFVDLLDLMSHILIPIFEIVGKVAQVVADAFRWVINTAIAIVNAIPFVHIDKVGAEAEDSGEQLRKFKNILSTVNSGLRDFASTIGSFIGDMLGPLGGAVDALIGGIFNATSAIISNLDDPLAAVIGIFDALVGVATGLLGTFFSLVKQSDAYQALQEELEPIWQALADAMGSFLWPLVAAVDVLKEMWGIADDLSEEAAEIADAGIAQGFKRARAVWRAALPDEVPEVDEEGEEFEIPEWAKKIGEDIAEAIDELITNLGQKLGLEEDENFFEFIERKIREWWEDFDIPDFSEWDWGPIEEFINGIEWEELKEEINDIVAQLKEIDWEVVGEQLSYFLEDGLEKINETLRNLELPWWLGGGGGGGEAKGKEYWAKMLEEGGVMMKGLASSALSTMALARLKSDKITSKQFNTFMDLLEANNWGKAADWALEYLQHGGIVTGPTPALIGESGPEAVIPLDRLDSMSQPQAVSVRLDIDGRELNSRLSEVDRRDEYTTHGSTRGKEGGYGRG